MLHGMKKDRSNVAAMGGRGRREEARVNEAKKTCVLGARARSA